MNTTIDDIKKRKRNILIVLLMILFIFIVITHLTKPKFISAKESGVTVKLMQDNSLQISFSEKVTASKMTNEKWENGENVIVLEGWTSTLDSILGRKSTSITVNNAGENVDAIYFFSNMEEDYNDNMTFIYGTDPLQDGGMIVYPGHVLGAYFIILLFFAFFLGILWFIFRKRKIASKILMYLFFVPVSYLIAHLILRVEFTSFTQQRDFILILVATSIIFGICMLISEIYKDKSVHT